MMQAIVVYFVGLSQCYVFFSGRIQGLLFLGDIKWPC